VEVADEDVGAGVRAAEAEVVEAAVVPEGDDAGFVDLVVPDSVVAGDLQCVPVGVASGRAW
jgi:hypothetical protein